MTRKADQGLHTDTHEVVDKLLFTVHSDKPRVIKVIDLHA